MSSLSITSISQQVWSIYKRHWKVLLIASLIPFVVSLLQQFVFDSSIGGSAVSLLAGILGFLSYVYQTSYIIKVHSGSTPDSKQHLRAMNVRQLWRILRTNIWMGFIILWPVFILIAVAGVLGFVITSDSFSGTTVSLIAMGIAAVVGAIIAFIRSLSYILMMYLAFTTSDKVRTLPKTSKNFMHNHKIKFLKLVLLQVALGIVGMLTFVLMPVVQSLIFISIVVFAERVIAQRRAPHAEVVNPE